MEFFTIGVYNSTEEDFFLKLKENNIDTFIDIRRRRGVRGAKYSFVNSKMLQIKLSSLGIKYKHILSLAPTKEIRDIQKRIDKKGHEQKRTRINLDRTFIQNYKDKILNNFNINDFLNELSSECVKRVVLFCVEEKPEACHRSIIAEEIQDNYKVTHL